MAFTMEEASSPTVGRVPSPDNVHVWLSDPSSLVLAARRVNPTWLIRVAGLFWTISPFSRLSRCWIFCLFVLFFFFDFEVDDPSSPHFRGSLASLVSSRDTSVRWHFLNRYLKTVNLVSDTRHASLPSAFKPFKAPYLNCKILQQLSFSSYHRSSFLTTCALILLAVKTTRP